MEYIYILIILFISEILYFKIANKYNIIDKPNERSSHSLLTIRGGGIIFPLAVIIAYIFNSISILFTISICLVAVISFIDDIKSLHQLPRFLSHLIAVVLIMFDINLFEFNILLIFCVIIFSIAWINAFNFMDGINGITVLYSLSSILSFIFLYQNTEHLSTLIIMFFACLIFSFFNVRQRAKTFAGDVGSISMAVFLSYFIIDLIFKTGQIAYILFFSIYGIDAFITILIRLKNKENIFKPHRTHLYQYLVNELKWKHIHVAIIYAISQTLINIYIIYLHYNKEISLHLFIYGILILTFFYVLIRLRVVTLINKYNCNI